MSARTIARRGSVSMRSWSVAPIWARIVCSVTRGSPPRRSSGAPSPAQRGPRIAPRGPGHRTSGAQRSRRHLDPGHPMAVGVAAEDPLPGLETGHLLGREEALVGEDGEQRQRAVALAHEEAITGLAAGVARVVAEDAVVEDPEDVERRVGARVVLLVAAGQRHQLFNARGYVGHPGRIHAAGRPATRL